MSRDKNTGALLRHYGMLESASEEMVEAARKGDWDSVCRLEAASVVVIAQLRALAEEQSLQPHEHSERLRILKAIVANDAEVRRIASPLPAYLECAPEGATVH